MMPGVSRISIGMITKTLEPLHKQPHPEALSWRFNQSTKVWSMQDKAPMFDWTRGSPA
jgi:hypothetical protein